MSNPLLTEQQKAQVEISPRRPQRSLDYQQIPLYKEVNPLDWEDWHWQVKHSIRKIDDLKQIINITPQEEDGLT